MFEEILGRQQMDGFPDPGTREGCRLWLERVLAFYGEDEPRDVDIAIIDQQLPLTEQTADYLYSEFTPPRPRYTPGERPVLEELVAQVVTDGMGEQDKALALMRRCRDNGQHGQIPVGSFTGGSEEELLKRGAKMCNEISRVFACLAQIAGLQARVFCSHMTGHMMNEVLVDGKWWWIDVMKGQYCFNDDGSPASAWDLKRDPSLFDRQKRSVWEDFQFDSPFHPAHPQARALNAAFVQAKCKLCYFKDLEATAIGNYFVADWRECRFGWHTTGSDRGREEVARHALHRLLRRLGWPEFYFDHKQFDGTLKTAD
jgi:hypothetical protein